MLRFANATKRHACKKRRCSFFVGNSRRFNQKSIPGRSFTEDGNTQAQRQQAQRQQAQRQQAQQQQAQQHRRHQQYQQQHEMGRKNSGASGRPQSAPNRLEELIRMGPSKPRLSTRDTSRSAMQSNLRGSPRSAEKQHSLLDFFQTRLADAGKAKEESTQSKENRNGNSNIRYPMQPPSRPSKPAVRPKIRRPLNLTQSFLMAAKAQATTAQDDKVNMKTTPVTSLGDQEHANTNLSGINLPTGQESEKKTASVSPISQFVEELKKKSLQQKNNMSAENTSTNEPKLASWRKTMERDRESQSLDPLFPTPQHNLSPVEPAEPESNPYLLHVAGRGEDPAKPRNTVVQPKSILLPSREVTIKELSPILGVKVSQIMKTLEGFGEIPLNDDDYRIDIDVVEMVAMELNIEVERPKRRQKTEIDDSRQLMERRKTTEPALGEVTSTDAEAVGNTKTLKNAYEQLTRRPPVVCIMGHVDHGKTTLMDSLRRLARGEKGKVKSKQSKKKKSSKKTKANQGSDDVAGTEAGGITQVISAFQVPLGDQKDSLTFLDTPGHAAFSAMRQSGSHAADVIVLVIAADDGVSKQTVEILNFYKSIVKESEGGITMVVAMNKIDKPGIDVQESQTRIENELIEQGILPEGVAGESEYGSPVQFFPISAKTGDGLDDLVEGLALQSEIMDLRADDTARAEGIVMDARAEQGLGIVVDCIIRWGSIKQGDVVVSGTDTGRVRILKDVDNKSIKKGTPSQPVRIVGFKTPPKAGDPVVCVANEKIAEELISRRLAIQERQRSQDEQSSDPNSNFSQVIISGRESMTEAGTEKKLQKYELDLEKTSPIRIPVVVKANADGSVAAVRDSLVSLGAESSFDLNIDVVAEGVGPLTMTDIEMAKISNATVFCFDVKNNDKNILAMAEAEDVSIHEYKIIYSLLDNAKELFTEYLPPIPVETVHGKAIVQAVFSISGGKEIVAGLKVLDGQLYKSSVEIEGKATPINFRVVRDGKPVAFEGERLAATSFRKFKEDVESVRQGEECGLSLSGVTHYEEGDVIECFSTKMIKSFA